MAKKTQEGGAAALDVPKTNILDADKAAEAQAAKPVDSFTVHIEGEVHTANAYTWGDAWAKVCDKRKRWPSIKYCGARVLDAEGNQVYPKA
jgi:hypothetical protein